MLLVSARRGHEKAVLRDVLDALFPYDTNVSGRHEGGLILVDTSLSPEQVESILNMLPIRNVLSARYVLGFLRAPPAVLAEELCRILERRGVKVRRVRVRLSSRAGWSQEHYAPLHAALREKGLLDPGGRYVVLEEVSGRVAITMVLNLQYLPR
uniref:THUMP domain-containing protein n=1 Tax=Thermofilum pendens TaxID=2269 RepID=A0A7J3X6N5_THEPE